jgi:hypothetical protein
VHLVDSAETLAAAAAKQLEAAGLFHDEGATGKLEFYLSDIPWTFTEVGAQFLGRPITDVRTVNLDELEAEGRLDLAGKGDKS